MKICEICGSKQGITLATSTPLLSVVLSFRNEADVIPELIQRLKAALAATPVEFELIFVNDDSTDNSLELLLEEAAADKRIKAINMARRFGVAECVLAGMKYAKGDAVVYMDADLQDPPELIPELIAKWQQGADVVYTVRTQRQGEAAFKLWLTRAAYRAINAASDIKLPVEAGDFKLLSRRAVNALLCLKEKNPYMRGLVTWIGFKQAPVYYTRQKRAGGITHFPIFRSRGPVTTFVYGLTSFSLLPLVFFLLAGLAICGLAVISIVAAGIALLLNLALPDWTVMAVLLLFSSGVQVLGIGTLGLYLGRVFNEVRNRPHYIVANTIGFEDDQL